MEAPVTSPQIPFKPNRIRPWMIGIVVLLMFSGIYFLYDDNKKAQEAERIKTAFADYLQNDQYIEAYALEQNLSPQNLGRHLDQTQLEMDKLLSQRIEQLTQDMLDDKEAAQTIISKINGMQIFKNKAEKTIQEAKLIIARCEIARKNTKEGLALAETGDLIGAIEKLQMVTEEDKETYKKAQEAMTLMLTKMNKQIEVFEKQGRYATALKKLDLLKTLFPENNDLEQKFNAMEIAQKEAEKNLVLYQGPVQHIFFHPLIAYPELTFDGDAQSRGFNEWFVTVPEFKKMIESIYAKGFILVDFDDLYDVEKSGEKEIIRPRELHLPKGKKPMVLSIDDLNYYRYMIQNGTVHKLIVDKEGKLATYTAQTGGDLIAYDNEIIPILDQFVEEHPDFSYRGAKGVIALTGYEGILGYRTDELDSPNFEEEKKEALHVVQALKDNGWSFASHGYGHLNTRDASYDRINRDTKKWHDEVQALIGPTDIYIYPFGASIKPEDPKFKLLQEAGFKVFCSVGPNPYFKLAEDYILMDRRHIDGIALFWQADSLRDLFESEQIIDPVRPILTR